MQVERAARYPQRYAALVYSILKGRSHGKASLSGGPMSPEIARKAVTTFQKIVPPKRSEYQLSPRELDVLKLLADGHSYKTAAHDLSLSTETIRFHIRHIYERLHVHSKSEAVVKAMHKGLLQ